MIFPKFYTLLYFLYFMIRFVFIKLILIFLRCAKIINDIIHRRIWILINKRHNII